MPRVRIESSSVDFTPEINRFSQVRHNLCKDFRLGGNGGSSSGQETGVVHALKRHLLSVVPPSKLFHLICILLDVDQEGLHVPLLNVQYQKIVYACIHRIFIKAYLPSSMVYKFTIQGGTVESSK